MASGKLFRLSEVAKCNDSRKAYIVIHNSVYDVTEFLNEVRTEMTCISLFYVTKYLRNTFDLWCTYLKYNFAVPGFVLKLLPVLCLIYISTTRCILDLTAKIQFFGGLFFISW